nr:response regulator transcription factor [uncultured Sphingomonas sp.]
MRSADRPIRVLIVDDHPMVRDGIAALLAREPDMTTVGEAEDGKEAVDRFVALAPDVTLMDVQMPGAGGIEAIEAIRRLSPSAAILVLTTYPGDAQAVSAMRAGASGYLLKNCIRKDLLDAIRAVNKGRRAISPDVVHALAVNILDEPLTDRERGVLRLVAEGMSNKQVAAELDIAADTVKAHLKSIYGKLRVDDRTHAVTIAVRRGFIER